MPPKKRKSHEEPVKINLEDLKEVRIIGKGGFGTVSHMIWKKDHATELDVATKRLLEVDHNDPDGLKHELGFLSRLEHPNIVRLLGIIPENINYMLVLELCHGGSLRSYLDDPRNPLPEYLQREWAVQAARAIEYLHDNGVIHKDVKSDNYLITLNGTLKLADFGLAKWTEITLNEATRRGTTAYMAPEMLRHNILSKKFDIFAYGVVIWELVTRDIPFDGHQQAHIIFTVVNGSRLSIPADCPKDFAFLMRECWLEDRHQRPNSQHILSVLTGQILVTTPASSLGLWTLQQKRMRGGMFGSAQGVAIRPKTQDITVTDFGGARVKIYSANCKIKHLISFKDEDRSTTPYAVASSPDGTYFVTDHTNCVTTIRPSSTKSQEVLQDKFIVEVPGVSADLTANIKLAGIALDNSRNLLIGAIVEEKGYICTYTHDGVPCGVIKISIQPQYLAVTSTNAIVISSPQEAQVQVIKHKGTLLHSLDPPEGVTEWCPCGVCSTEGMVLVANHAEFMQSSTSSSSTSKLKQVRLKKSPFTGIYCYSISGKYLSCITKEVLCPRGLAITDDGRTLIVAESKRDAGVKIFRREDTQCLVRRDKHYQIPASTRLQVFSRKESEPTGNSECTHSSTTAQQAVTVRRNDDLVTLTLSTIRHDMVDGVSACKKLKHLDSHSATSNSRTSEYSDSDDDTLDLTLPIESCSSQRTESSLQYLEAANSSSIYDNGEAVNMPQRMAPSNTAESDQATDRTGGSLKYLSDNLDWLGSLKW